MVIMGSISHFKKFNHLFTVSIAVALVVMAQSCEKNKIEPREAISSTTETGLLWKIPNRADTGACISMSPIISGDNIIISEFVDFEVPETLRCFSLTTKELLWEWYDYEPLDTAQYILNRSDIKIYQGSLVFPAQNSVYQINIADGTTMWSDIHLECYPMMSLWGDMIFRATFDQLSNDMQSGDLVYTKVGSSDWTSLFHFQRENNRIKLIVDVNPEINQDGDTLLFFQIQDMKFFDADVIITVACYNFSTREFVWKSKPIPTKFGGNSHDFLIKDSFLIFNSSEQLWCFNTWTGEEQWVADFNYYSFSCSYNLYNDLIINYEDNSFIKAYDYRTGKVAWMKETYTVQDYLIFEDYLIITTSDLKFIDLNTQNDIRTITTYSFLRDELPGEEFTSIPLIDPDKRLLYITDKKFLRCYDLNVLLSDDYEVIYF